MKPRHKYRIAGNLILFMFVIALAVALIASVSVGDLQPLFGLLFPVVLIILAGVLLRWRYRQIFRSQPSLQGRHSYSFTDAGFTVESPHGRGERSWSALTRWREDSNLFVLYQAKNLFFLLPKRWFDSTGSSIDEFRALLQKHSLQCID